MLMTDYVPQARQPSQHPEFTIVSEKYDTILNLLPQVDHKNLGLHGAFQNEIDHFITCCRSREETISPVQDGVKVAKMIFGIYESGRSGSEIRFKCTTLERK